MACPSLKRTLKTNCVSNLPSISGKKCTGALGCAGFRVRRQEISYVILRRNKPFAQITVPEQSLLDRRTLRLVLRTTGLSVDEFVGLLS